MRRGLICLLLLLLLVQPVSAAEFEAPQVPEQGQAFMPEKAESFGEGLWYVIRQGISRLRPELAEAAGICMSLVALIMLISLVQSFGDAPGRVLDLSGTVAVAALLIRPANSMISLGLQTVRELSQYGKLLLPVMTAATAAQGGFTASDALYTGSACLLALQSAAVSGIIGPVLCAYLCLCVAHNAIGDGMLGRLRSLAKWLMTWGLKIILYVFTGYMSITGAVSGTADAAALKATKLTISGVVPVVGGILADASEAVLVGAGVMKSAAGVYGLLAILATCISPFLKIATQYLLLKATAAICGVFGAKAPVGMIRDFSGVMGFVLAMTGSVCLLLMISVVCFLKGVG